MAGLVAVGAALAVGELAVGVVPRAVTPVVAVGGWVIDHVPAAVKRFAIATFGTNDKLALRVGILAVLLLVAAGIGLLARRRPWLGTVGAAAFGAVGVAAGLGRAGVGVAGAVVPPLAGAAAAALALCTLVPRAGRAAPAAASPAAMGVDRRRFVLGAAGIVVGSAATGGLGAALQRRRRVDAARNRVVLPRPARPAPARPADVDLGVPGVDPFATPDDAFYRIDTALTLPQVDPHAWRLTVRGLVDRPRSWTYDELLALPLVERDLTLVCVSNEVGGHLAGTARWLGVPLADLLHDARVRPGADQLVSRSVDGFTAGTPVSAVLDGRDALVVVGMNGRPLPVAHGFPARLIVPGLYGYVSATKWVTELELTTFDAFDAYWVRRGWAAQAPVKTMARIDTPRGLSSPAAGRVAVAGVAWAPHRGVRAVEVRIDEGPWLPARLAGAPSADTWRQWSFDWDAPPGRHTVAVRAVDGAGATQTDERRPPMPDGASGHHSVVVLVR